MLLKADLSLRCRTRLRRLYSYVTAESAHAN
jgi:hypothetical protein